MGFALLSAAAEGWAPERARALAFALQLKKRTVNASSRRAGRQAAAAKPALRRLNISILKNKYGSSSPSSSCYRSGIWTLNKYSKKKKKRKEKRRDKENDVFVFDNLQIVLLLERVCTEFSWNSRSLLLLFLLLLLKHRSALEPLVDCFGNVQLPA